jgi:metal-responsive CopG/Arc/MetJ family transcriptional regulator
MGNAKSSTVIRRSVAIPRALAVELEALIPAAERPSFNGLVLTALKAYLKAERRRAFAAEMARMAADPEIQREIKAIDREFRCTEMDGLEGL